MISSIVLNRARRRGHIESTKLNAFYNQLLYDLKRLQVKLDAQETDINDNFTTARDDVSDLQEKAYKLLAQLESKYRGGI